MSHGLPPIGGDTSGRARPGCGTGADLDKCAVCPKLCRHACPAVAASGNEAHVPSVKSTTWRRISKGLEPPSAAQLRTLFACTDCNAATRYCKHDIEPSPLLAEARAFAQAQGLAPAALQPLIDNLDRTRNPFGETPDARPQTGAMLIYLPGCATLKYTPEAVDAACQLLEAAGQRFDLRTDICSGAPASYAGRPELVSDWQMPMGATVVSSCPGAVTSLRRRYPTIHAVHLASYLAPLQGLRLARKLEGDYLFHDPCHLARHQADVASPRQLLDRAIAGRRLELPDHGPDTACSGGGGLLPLVFPRMARTMARRRVDDALRAGDGSRTLVTACPGCHRQLSRDGRIQVVDLAQLLSETLR